MTRSNVTVIILSALVSGHVFCADELPAPQAPTFDKSLINIDEKFIWPLADTEESKDPPSDVKDLSFTGTPPELFQSANSNFEEGKFDLASIKYKGLTGANLISPDLFYNLGTALYRAGESGEAILWLRRALIAQPGMPEATQNLEFLRGRLGFLEFTESKIDRGLRTLPPTFGKWLFWSAFWIGLIALAAAFCIAPLRPNRSGLITLAIVSLMLAIVGNRIEHYSKIHLALQNFATITEDDVSAVTAPTPDAESVIELPPGSEVRILQVAGKWIYVDIPGDLRGWIRRDQLEQVWPISTKTS